VCPAVDFCDCGDEHYNSKQHFIAVTVTRKTSRHAGDLGLAPSRSKNYTSSQSRQIGLGVHLVSCSKVTDGFSSLQ